MDFDLRKRKNEPDPYRAHFQTVFYAIFYFIVPIWFLLHVLTDIVTANRASKRLFKRRCTAPDSFAFGFIHRQSHPRRDCIQSSDFNDIVSEINGKSLR